MEGRDWLHIRYRIYSFKIQLVEQLELISKARFAVLLKTNAENEEQIREYLKSISHNPGVIHYMTSLQEANTMFDLKERN